MKVILLQDVFGVGHKYEVKTVSHGYARNFLIPRKLAQIATLSSLKAIEVQKIRVEQERAIQKDILEKNLESLNNARIEIERKANEKGHLFDSVDKKEIEIILKDKRMEIPADMIELEKPIKEIGEHKIKIGDKEFTLAVKAS